MAADLRVTSPPPRAAGGTRELDEPSLRRAQRGDHAAFRTLVETYQTRVWELCWRMLAPVGLGHRAEDVSQDTFVRVFRYVGGFEPGGAARLSTWILTIATRRALSELARTRPRGGDDEALAALETAVADDAGAGHATARRELGDQLAKAIAALPDGARAVLLLRDLYDLEYAEIAHALELDLGTVKSRLARARAAVRARLGGVLP